jgi:hypothetical protein
MVRRTSGRGEAVSGHHHVQFYDREPFLYDVVAGYLGAGLEAGQPLLVVATEAHREAFCRALEEDGFDVVQARADGRLTLLDARETLATLMVDAMPDWDRFRRSVGELLQACAARGGQAPIRVYGEMVDLLVRDGHPQAALRLEEYWNELGKSQPFILFCSYSMDGFAGAEQRQQFEACAGSTATSARPRTSWGRAIRRRCTARSACCSSDRGRWRRSWPAGRSWRRPCAAASRT